MTAPEVPTDDEVARARDTLGAFVDGLRGVVLGQPDATGELTIGLVADGHVLLEGIPGVGKTLLAHAAAALLSAKFTRVQFTPDLMPTDLVGTRVFNAETHAWEFHRGPVFTDVLLADEINRTPPKTQAALLEAMEERQVTVDGETHPLGETFFVIATENPLEFEGTYPLPEAQTDRFLLNIRLRYPSADAERALLGQPQRRASEAIAALEPVLTPTELARLRALARAVRVDGDLVDYALAILHETRASDALKLGASPRAGVMLLSAARARALMEGRGFVLPDDIKHAAHPVLRHRLALSTEAELDGLSTDDVLDALLDRVKVRADG